MGPPLRGEAAARQLEGRAGRTGTCRTFCRRETGDSVSVRVRVRGPHFEKSRKSWVWARSEQELLLIKVAKGPVLGSEEFQVSLKTWPRANTKDTHAHTHRHARCRGPVS